MLVRTRSWACLSTTLQTEFVPVPELLRFRTDLTRGCDYTIPDLVTRLRLAISLNNNAAGRGNVTAVVYVDDISLVLKSLPIPVASTTTVE